jgi:hypothetical protein
VCCRILDSRTTSYNKSDLNSITLSIIRPCEIGTLGVFENRQILLRKKQHSCLQFLTLSYLYKLDILCNFWIPRIIFYTMIFTKTYFFSILIGLFKSRHVFLNTWIIYVSMVWNNCHWMKCSCQKGIESIILALLSTTSSPPHFEGW